MQRIVRSRAGAVIGGAAVVALLSGGAAVAHGMIGSADIKDHSIQKRDISRNAVGSLEVLDGSLGLRDFNGFTKRRISQPGPAGSPGETGPQGPAGPMGPAGPAGRTPTVTYLEEIVRPTSEESAEYAVPCPAGTQVINGFVLPGHTAWRSLGRDYLDPDRNAFVFTAGASSEEPDGGSLSVQVVCLG